MLLKNFLGRFCIGLVLSTLHLSGPTIAGDHHQKQLGAGKAITKNSYQKWSASTVSKSITTKRLFLGCADGKIHLLAEGNVASDQKLWGTIAERGSILRMQKIQPRVLKSSAC